MMWIYSNVSVKGTKYYKQQYSEHDVEELSDVLLLFEQCLICHPEGTFQCLYLLTSAGLSLKCSKQHKGTANSSFIAVEDIYNTISGLLIWFLVSHSSFFFLSPLVPL